MKIANCKMQIFGEKLIHFSLELRQGLRDIAAPNQSSHPKKKDQK